MPFLNPWVLFALGAVAIPIVIHLFHFRRYKTVLFPNVRLLKETKWHADARSRLRHLLVLACRILAITFLVMAFAQPIIKQGNQWHVPGRSVISIYLDNSFTMERLASGSNLLEAAKKQARQLVARYGDGHQYQILTNDFRGAEQRLVDAQEALLRIQSVSFSPQHRTIDQVLARQQDALAVPATSKLAFLLTDAQRTTMAALPQAIDTTMHVFLIPFQSATGGNLYIDTCRLWAPVQLVGQQAMLTVRIRNESNTDVMNERLTLTLNDEIKALSEFSVLANGMVEDTLFFTFSQPGWSRGVITVTDYPITFDDSYFFTCKAEERLQVLEITESSGNPFVRALCAESEFLALRSVVLARLPHDEIRKSDVVVGSNLRSLPSGLAAQLKEFLEQGGNVALFVPLDADIDSYNDFLTAVGSDRLSARFCEECQVKRVNTRHPVFREVFARLPENVQLPQAQRGRFFEGYTRARIEPLLTAANQQPVIIHTPVGAGNLYVSAWPLDLQSNDLGKNPLFPPMLFNMAAIRSYVQAQVYTIGSDQRVPVLAGALPANQMLLLRSKEQEMIPLQRRDRQIVNLFPGDEGLQAGFYEITDRLGNQYGWLAFNYDRAESRQDFLSEEELRQLGLRLGARVIKTVSGAPLGTQTGQTDGLPLWKVSIILALVFLCLEVLLLKFRNVGEPIPD